MAGHGLAAVVDLGQTAVVGVDTARRRCPREWSPPCPNGCRWWNSSPSRAVHRRPCVVHVAAAAHRLARSTALRTAAGMWREEGDISLCESPLRGAFVRAKRRASSRSSFSVTASSMIAARSPSGTEERMSASQPFELVAELGAGGELDLVAGGGQRLDATTGGAGRDSVWTEFRQVCRSWVRTESGLGRRDSVRTQFGLARASSVWTQSATVHRASLRIPSEHGRLGARAEPEGRRRRPGPAVGQLPHHRRSIRTRRHLGDQLLDLSLGPVGRPLQEIVPVLRRQVRCQLRDAGQVKPPVGQHGQEHRVLSRRPCRRDAQVGFGLREVKDLRAPGEHRGRGLAGVEPARVHLADVGNEVGLAAAGASQELGQAAEQLVVRDQIESAVCSPCRQYRQRLFGLLGSRVFDATAGNRGCSFGLDCAARAPTTSLRQAFLRSSAVPGRTRARKLSRGKCRNEGKSIG